MRQIDADALTEAFDTTFFNDEDDYKRALRIIDNAPTVAPCYQTTSCLDCKNYDKEKYNCPRFCEVIRSTIEEIQQEEKALIDSAPTVMNGKDYDLYLEGYRQGKKGLDRPKGEWIDKMATEGYVVCPFCGKEITGGDLNFCVKCGADMRTKENSNG